MSDESLAMLRNGFAKSRLEGCEWHVDSLDGFINWYGQRPQSSLTNNALRPLMHEYVDSRQLDQYESWMLSMSLAEFLVWLRKYQSSAQSY